MFTEKLSALQLRQEKLEKKLDSNSDETRQILMEILNRLDVLVRETTGKYM
jgi:BMFP domain-containing protein YqiC